jgi:uncharacterized protein
MISMEETARGTILSVKAHAGARRTGLAGIHDGALKLAVAQVPEKGKANTALVKLLAEILEIGKNQIELVSGQTSSHKKFLIQGLSADELSVKLFASLNELDGNLTS